MYYNANKLLSKYRGLDLETLYDLLLLKDIAIASLDQLRKDNIEKIERLQKYQTELEKEIKTLEERLKLKGFESAEY